MQATKILLVSFLLFVLGGAPTGGANWMTFKLAHLLNPDSPEGRACEGWSVGNWTTWLHARDVLNGLERDESGSRVQKNLYQKPIDSVIVASPGDLMQAFLPPLKLYKKGRDRGDYVWSNRPFLVYNILFGQHTRAHRVYRCAELFVTGVVVEDNQLVHFERAYPQALENYRGNLQIGDLLKLDNCREI